ncbi:MAG: ABC transporter ATP-binding protein [Bacteroidota bacterium]
MSINNIQKEAKALLQEDLLQGITFLDKVIREHSLPKDMEDQVLFLHMEMTEAKSESEIAEIREEAFDMLATMADHFNSKTVEPVVVEPEKPDPGNDKKKVGELNRSIVLEAKELHKKYNSGFELAQFNAIFKLGEITGVVGENANGKTTLFDILAGKKAKTSGKVIFPTFQKKGSSDWRNLKKEIAYVTQELGQRFGSLKNLLHHACSAHGIYGEENDKQVNYIIHRLGLYEHINKAWDALSGGFKLRFALAEALVWKPKLLILDEPLANLDVNAQLLVLTDILNLAKSLKNPISVIISSQHLMEVESIADRLIFLDKGKMVFNGSIDEVGAGRKENIYEFSTDIPMSDLEAKLSNIPHNSLEFNGLNYMLFTPLTVENQHVFKWFTDEKIDVGYFRNISHSIKKFFV